MTAAPPDDTADRDWLYPDGPTSTPAPATERFTGVIRVDEWGGRGVRFATLAAALKASPPATPEAQIYGIDGMLAECHPDSCRWALLTVGTARLAAEHDADNILACVLAEDFRRSA